jgi:hypothetical protein
MLAGAAAMLTIAASMLGVDGGTLPKQARWRALVTVPGVVDVVGPRADGRLVLATHAGLRLLRPGHAPQPFAPGYAPSPGETYIALASDRRLPRANCAFERDDLYALDPTATPGLTRIDRRGRAARFADLPPGSFPSGIAFDRVGRFGGRLLVTALLNAKIHVYGFDCRGRSHEYVADGPPVEGGIAVAPRSFGRFAGHLIAASEATGRIFAFDPSGAVRPVAESGLPFGGDIGVESVGFVPSGLGSDGAAYLADMGAPGSPTQGTDSVLVLRGDDLARARLRAGELVAATEGGAKTIAIRCARRCTVRRFAVGPAATHGEGHVTFARG